jgi:hypothetical protein
MLFERGALAEVVVVQRGAGVVDEDVERVDALDCFINLRRVGHVQRDVNDAPVRGGRRAGASRHIPASRLS